MENPSPLPNKDTVKPSKRKHSIIFPPHGKTKQAMRDECDVNRIMAKYQTSGLIEFVNNNEAQYGDATGVDFQTSMETVTKANAMFAEMPSKHRKFFDNDTSKFLNFVNDPANRQECVTMGLIKPDADRRTPPAREERTRASDAPAAPSAAPPTPPAT